MYLRCCLPIVVAAVLIGCGTQKPTTPFTPDPALQAKRKAFAEKLIANGVFTKIVKPGQLPEAWATHTFKALDFDAKQEFCSAVYAYYFPDPASGELGNQLKIMDSLTGKRIGTFSPQWGLSID